MAAKKKSAVKKVPAKKASALRKVAAKAKTAVRGAAKKATKRLDATAKKAAKAATTQARVTAAKKQARKAPLVKKVSAGTPAQAITVGQEAPEFSLPGDDGQTHSLSAHRGQPVVLYFYPKDNTPGCTQEACDFRDNLARARGKGAVVYGVSTDSVVSHQKFREKYSLNFPLLADTERTAHRAYGTWGKKSLYGREFEGTIRSTFLIDRQGKIARAWPKVSVGGHVDEVIAAIEALPS